MLKIKLCIKIKPAIKIISFQWKKMTNFAPSKIIKLTIE